MYGCWCCWLLLVVYYSRHILKICSFNKGFATILIPPTLTTNLTLAESLYMLYNVLHLSKPPLWNSAARRPVFRFSIHPRSLTASLPLKNDGKVTFHGRTVKLREGITLHPLFVETTSKHQTGQPKMITLHRKRTTLPWVVDDAARRRTWERYSISWWPRLDSPRASTPVSRSGIMVGIVDRFHHGRNSRWGMK